MSEPRKITLDDVDRILNEHPTLGEYGYNHPDADTAEELDISRRRLRRQVADIQSAYDWLLTLHPLPDGGLWPTSYSLKHDGERSGKIGYVTNGAMIVAALLAQLPMRLDPPNPAVRVALTAPRPTPPADGFTA
ncbi:hypothetical protein [Micromonospora sp. NPDC047730]|uniref:hypothetical protein n=1 Tax=Micromonospora sp. NPDC047730 TaxID=3364253 RepID=UPI00371A01F1